MELIITEEYLKKNNYDYTVNEKGHITINCDFDCSYNELTSLTIPDNFTVGGDFDCSHNELTSKINIKTCYVSINLKLQKKLSWKNGKYRKIDNIFCEILKEIKNIFVCKKLNQKEKFYIFHKNNIFAHGKTPKQAYFDWLFKISDRDTTQYNNLSMDDIKPLDFWVVAYRTITGACTFGTNEYLENNKDKYKSEMSLKEVIEATENQYGHNTFVEFFNNKVEV